MNMISEVKDVRVFVIISDDHRKETAIPLMIKLSVVEAIYVLTGTTERNRTAKVGAFANLHTLIDHLTMDMHQVECELLRFRISPPRPTSLNSAASIPFIPGRVDPKWRQEVHFRFEQRLKETLLEADLSDKATDMIAHFRSNYPYSTLELNEMSEDTNWSAVKWYARKGILYRILNRALRTNDLEALHALCLFIRQLHTEIVELHPSQPMEFDLTLYRVQMNNADLEQLKLNRDGLFSWNAFTFANNSREDAENFTCRPAGSSKKPRVLFIITVPAVSGEAPIAFAKVAAENEEYLFSFTSIFRIGQMQKHENNMSWIVHLTLANVVKETPQWLERNLCEEQILTKATRLCVLMSLLGDHEKAEQFCHKQLLDTTSEWKCRASALHGLGQIALQREPPLLDKALYYFQQVLEFKLQYITVDHFSLSSDYKLIGCIYLLKDKFDLALENIQCALTTELSIPLPLTPDPTKIATYYHNISVVLLEQRKPAEALAFCYCALDIRNTLIPTSTTNLALAHTDNTTALCLRMMHRYTEAIEYSQMAAGTASHIVPPESCEKRIYETIHYQCQISKKFEQCTIS